MVDKANLMDLMVMYLTDCQVRKLAPRTIDGYRKLLRPIILWLGDSEKVEMLGDLVPQHLKMYLLYKAQYINDILRVMRTFSRYLYDEGYVVCQYNALGLKEWGYLASRVCLYSPYINKNGIRKKFMPMA